MKRAVWVSIVLSLVIPAGAEPFGAPFPVTNTRYRTAAAGAPRLVTNDRDFFLFWGSEMNIRVARVDDGEARVSHAVLDANEPFDVAWTGEHYVILSSRTEPATQSSTIVGRVLDAEARPTGAEFTLPDPTPRVANSPEPRIAVGEHSLAVVYRKGLDEIRLVLLSRDGRTVETPSRVIARKGSTYAIARTGEGFLAIVGSAAGIRAMALDQHGQTVAENLFAMTPNAVRRVAVASNGTKSLAVWGQSGALMALPVDASAGFGVPLELLRAPGDHRTPDVLWNGAAWTVSYAEASTWADTKAVIVQLDREGQRILAREESAAGGQSPTIAALGGQILAAWGATGLNQPTVVAEVPLARNRRRETPYVPLPQTVLATASSAGATLTVWSESIEGGHSIHSGVRTAQGQWSERLLATTAAQTTGGVGALAVGDGEGFAVAVITGNSCSLVRLDSAGRPSAPIRLPRVPAVMAWNGTSYALIDNSLRGFLVSPAGVVSRSISIDGDMRPAALASDGDGFLLVGFILGCEGDFGCIPSIPRELRAARLRADLTQIDPEDQAIPDGVRFKIAGAAWDGSRYVVIGHDEGMGRFLWYVPPYPYSGNEIHRLDTSFDPEAMAVLHDGTIAVAGQVNGTISVSFVTGEGAVLQTSDINGSPTGRPQLVPLADGVAFIASTVQAAAPHDGTSRIVTAIARSSSVLPPAAPHSSMRVQNGIMTVDWTTPAGTVNGYRLEYRVDDDAWLEWEEWFGPGAHSKSIRQPDFGTQFTFRVRAFNDGGAGPYSGTPPPPKPGRRRAVR